MGKRQDFFYRLADSMELPGEPMPGQPVIEIAGDKRVLLENHFGVKEYCPERIAVKVKYGMVIICGCGLELKHMSSQQLVISGRINAVTLQRRG